MKKIRRAARALLISPEGKILLMRLEVGGSDRSIWVAPGGGLEEGEDARLALAREVEEETGRSGVTIGPLVWLRNHEFTLNGEEVHQFEEYFLCPVAEFEAKPVFLEVGDERNWFRELRWWPIAEIGLSREVFVPRTIYRELLKVLAADSAAFPTPVGV